jgi:anaphase-promoting complex subunit 10
VDESYTPKKIAISCGTTIQDLYDVKSVELNEPVGWVTIQLESLEMQGQLEVSEMLRTHLLQVKVLSMHQNGRDTHIRQIKVFGPRESPIVMGGVKYNRFKTIEMQQYALLR